MLPPIVTIASPTWHASDSYGRYALEVLQQMEQAGMRVNTMGGGAPNAHFELTGVNLLFGYPTQFQRFGRIANWGTKVALTTWESTVLPPDWARILNTFAAVVVPCHWNAELFRENGVNVPLHVVPHGVSDSFHYVERSGGDKPFRFLCIGDRRHRKGYIEAMNAFYRAFGKRDDVELIIKARSQVIPELTNGNIRLIKDDYDDAQMQELYASADCFLCPAKSEGFGMPPREAALTGALSVCTNFSGMADDIDQWGYGIGYTLTPAWEYERQFQGLGEWATIDEDELVARMIAIHQMPLEARNAQGRRFSQNVARLYRWSDVGKRLLGILSELTEVRDANRRTA